MKPLDADDMLDLAILANRATRTAVSFDAVLDAIATLSRELGA